MTHIDRDPFILFRLLSCINFDVWIHYFYFYVQILIILENETTSFN